MTESITIHHLRRCAGPECGRIFAVCRSCGWTRRYCSSSCRDETRRRRVREAGHRYQQSIGGRQAHAARQARYRERQRVQSRAPPLTPTGDAASVSDEGGRGPGGDGKECGPAERDPASTLTPEAACARAEGHDGGRRPRDGSKERRSAERGLVSTLEAASSRAVSERGCPGDDGEESRPGLLEERWPAERDVVSVPLVTHHPSGQGPSSGGPEMPSRRPIERPRGASAVLGPNRPPLPRCAFCGRGHDRIFLIVDDGPPPDPARLGRRFRWRSATEPAGPEFRVL